MTLALPTVDSVPEISYQDFESKFKYSQRQHVTICGPTGCGKSELIVNLLVPRQPFSVYLSTKPRDATIERSLSGKDFGWTDDPKEIHPWIHRKWVVGLKKFGDPETVRGRHRELFKDTLKRFFPDSGWALNVDEGRYTCDPKYLGLSSLIAQYQLQGRSDDKSVVIATQRPRFIPLESFDQAVHLFFFNDEDFQNVVRMAEACGANRKLFTEIIPHLETTDEEGDQFLYFNRISKERYISKLER